MFKRFRFSFIVAASLLFAGLACNYSNRLAQAPIQTTPPLVTPQNLENLQPQSTQSLQPLQESLTTSAPEEQLTAIVVKELQTQQDQPIEDPQILLRDGEVQVLGNVKQGALTLPLKMSISVSVNDQGRPQYRVDTANVGPLPLPQSTLDQLSTQLDAALNENLGSEINNVYIENITIADGLMTVTGHQRQP